MTTPTPLALHTIIHTVQRGFEKHFSARTFRCQAEVMQIKIHKSRVYIDLVEYDPAGTILAKARAIIRERELLDHYLHVI